MQMITRTLSSLEKVFWDEPLSAPEYTRCTALRGERVSFQVACMLSEEQSARLSAEAEWPLGTPELFDVQAVPVTLPCYGNADEHYLRKTPGLYPDLLKPHEGGLRLVHGQWRCLWISVTVPDDAPAGGSVVRFRLFRADRPGETVGTAEFTVDVIPALLPEQSLLHTEWFHNDCLATWYNVPVFGERHWEIIENYMRCAARFGINMILTPVFTPPLDTEPGGERPTVQLTDVTVTDSGYAFGFDKLSRYMELAESCGIRYFEISHLFTQWGAAHAPKIIARTESGDMRVFGWETDASGESYTRFLNSFLRELRTFLEKSGRLSRCYFHISDEPGMGVIENYRRAAGSVHEVLHGCHIIDALSDYAFYETGIIKKPIPASNHIDDFIRHGVPGLWTYYCCSQGVDVSNRFIAMPSARCRVLGYQLYKYDIEGFLQWGYNFWYSRLSKERINPFTETSALDAFPAGDAFIVYPGENGMPLSSLRQVVFAEALQDLRALRLLEKVMPKKEILAMLESEGELTFKNYPRSPRWIHETRERINQLIGERYK